MPEVVLTPGVLPQPQCYADEQSRFEAYVAAIITSLTGGLQWTASTTAPTDLTQYWLKTDTSNPGDPTYARGLEILKWSVPDAAWVRVFSVPSSTGVIGGVVNSFTLTHSPPYITAASAYRVGQVYVFIANNAITGASTLNVDGLGAKAIKKRVTVDLAENDILEDQMVSVIFDGTNFQMLSEASTYDLSNFPGGEFGEVLKMVGPYPSVTVDWDSFAFASDLQAFPATQGAAATPVSHNFSSQPSWYRWVAVCNTPEHGYLANEEVPTDCLIESNASSTTSQFSTQWVDTVNGTLNLRRANIGVNTVYMLSKTAGALSVLTPGSWMLKVYYAR
jgi:hypothetical protein